MINPIRFIARHTNRLTNYLLYSTAIKKYYCPVCSKSVPWFDPMPLWYFEILNKFEYIHSITDSETFNIGAMTCPECKAPDKYRLYALYLDKFFKTINEEKKFELLDIAPMKCLSDKLKTFPYIKYRTCDLYDPNVDDQVDVQDMNIYPNNSVDIFICSHVLEHVENDKKAVSELFRILKPGGWGILMVPINLSLEKTYEDKSKRSKAEQWKYFGDVTHKRVYAKKDYIRLLESAHFTVKQYGVDFFGKDIFNKQGINERSILYVVEKYD